MNDLDLPPRRTLPPEVRDRIRTRIDVETPPATRRRAPLAVAAGVALLIAGIVAVQSTTGPPDAPRSGSQELSVVTPDSRTSEDLDRCADVATASPRAEEFAPRAEWLPVFTATLGDTRIVAFRTNGAEPMFCELTADTITVSDPDAVPMAIAEGRGGTTLIYALYLSPAGLVAGVAKDVSGLECWMITSDLDMRAVESPILRDELFVMDVSALDPGDRVEVLGRDSAGIGVANGWFTYDPAEVRPVGATGPA
jgi:hypothetical protein